jgi:hypothetical protein
MVDMVHDDILTSVFQGPFPEVNSVARGDKGVPIGEG